MQYSHSRIGAFEKCPFKYKMQYLDRLKTLPPTEPDNALILGTAVHTGIEQSLQAAIQQYFFSYPIITDKHINEAIKLEQVIPKARAAIPPGGSFEVPIQTVQTAIDPEENAGEGYGLAPIGHVVKVDTAAEIRVNVNTSIVFDTGYSWSNLQSSIENAISGYLLELRKEWAGNDYLVVRISQIESRIMAIQGVIDISGTKINGNAANLTLTPFEIPVFGGAGA